MSTVTPELRDHRLRTLYQMMSGIPESVIYMNCWRDAGRDSAVPAVPKLTDRALLRRTVKDPECGTTACALGWACAYPEFKAAGLKFSTHLGYPVFKGGGQYRYYHEAGAAFFGLTQKQSVDLFGVEYNSTKSHKKVFLRRLRSLMLDFNMITKQRCRELEKEPVT